jgi:hypothetical protein
MSDFTNLTSCFTARFLTPQNYGYGQGREYACINSNSIHAVLAFEVIALLKLVRSFMPIPAPSCTGLHAIPSPCGRCGHHRSNAGCRRSPMPWSCWWVGKDPGRCGCRGKQQRMQRCESLDHKKHASGHTCTQVKLHWQGPPSNPCRQLQK